jgi:hypothetical protein
MSRQWDISIAEGISVTAGKRGYTRVMICSSLAQMMQYRLPSPPFFAGTK